MSSFQGGNSVHPSHHHGLCHRLPLMHCCAQHSSRLPRTTQQQITTCDAAVDRHARHSSGSLCTMQQWISVRDAAVDCRVRHSSRLPCTMQQWLMEQGVDMEDPLLCATCAMVYPAQHNGFSHYLGQDAGYQGYPPPQPQNTPTWDAR